MYRPLQPTSSDAARTAYLIGMVSANQREAKETDLSIHRNPQLQVPLVPQLTPPTPRLSDHQ